MPMDASLQLPRYHMKLPQIVFSLKRLSHNLQQEVFFYIPKNAVFKVVHQIVLTLACRASCGQTILIPKILHSVPPQF